MGRPDREPVVIFGMVGMLLVASVVPLALPVLRADSPLVPPDDTQTDGPNQLLTANPSDSGATGTTDRPAPATSRCDNSGRSPTPDSTMDEVTGDDVSVAIIDPSGFAVGDSAFGDQVVTTASFDQDGDLGIRNGGNARHGTASARRIARLAPDASLYLANFRTAHDFTEAVDWAINQDVDVIVAPTVFYAKPNDGSAPVSRAVTKAAANGITVVVPTGNAAGRHWEGTYTGEGAVEFAPGDTRMYLEGDSNRVGLWLWWNRSGAAQRHDFSVVLYRETDNGTRRVAESAEYPEGPVGTNQVLTEKIRTNNLLSRSISGASYFVRIEGPPNVTHRVELVVTTHRLERPTARGSIVAPATARGAGVIAVGAGKQSTGRPMATSGRGPTNDGRTGIDILAPANVTDTDRFTGSSAAASYTGGVVALMQAVNASLSPGDIEVILKATASNDGPSLDAGWGMIDVEAALLCASGSGPSE